MSFNLFFVLISFQFLLTLNAQDQLPQPKGGPLALIYDKLTYNQKHELDAIVESAGSGTKGEFRAKISKFVDGLSDELKQSIQKPKTQYDAIKAKLEQRVRGLTSGAQEIFFGLKTIVEDDSLTFEQEHEKIQQIFEHINIAALNELQQHQIPLPGIPPQVPQFSATRQ